ncbi:MAG: hypothetical protein RLZZ385_2331 [Pseudomonadota bacterium]
MSLAEARATAGLQGRIRDWMAGRLRPTPQTTLHLRTIYIIPSRHGLMFLGAAGLVFIAAINYAISLAFGLAFLMVSLFILTVIHSFNNLHRLTLTALPSRPVFCGEDAAFQVQLSRDPRQRHEALELGFQGGHVTRVDLVEADQATVSVFAAATRRGLMRAPRLRVTTYYPLGLARAWSVVDLDMRCLVYPKPVPVAIEQAMASRSGSGESLMTRDGSEDFYGLRNYVIGDSMKQVAWKNVARGQGMQVKQFVEYADDRIWLDWDMFYGFSTEERLSRLCYCVLTLARGSTAFGLRLPGQEVAPAKGQQHRNRLLEILALYGSQGEGSGHGN